MPNIFNWPTKREAAPTPILQVDEMIQFRNGTPLSKIYEYPGLRDIAGKAEREWVMDRKNTDRPEVQRFKDGKKYYFLADVGTMGISVIRWNGKRFTHDRVVDNTKWDENSRSVLKKGEVPAQS